MPRPELGDVWGKFKPALDKAVGSTVDVLFRPKDYDKYQPYEPFKGNWEYAGSFPAGQYLFVNQKRKKYEQFDRNTWDTQVGSFQLCQLPGCCGVCVLYHTYTYGDYQRKGIGKILHQFKIEMAKNMGYGLALCTNVTEQTAMDKIMKGFKWTKLHTFLNPRTQHTVNLSVLPLI